MIKRGENMIERSVEKTKKMPLKNPYKNKKKYRKRSHLSSVEKTYPIPLRTSPKAPAGSPVKKPGKEQEQKKDRGVLKKLQKSKPYALYLSIFAAAILLVAQSAMVAQLNHQIIQKENKLETLQNEKTYLHMQVVEQTTPERIEKIAADELEMRNPTGDEIINIE